MSDVGYVIAASVFIVGVVFVKKMFFPLRCPRCRNRAYTQLNDVSDHLILRCPKCGYIEDQGEVTHD